MRFALVILFQISITTLCASAVLAQSEAPATPDEAQTSLVVGVKVSPPFSMKAPDGSWYGISVDLWKEIAKELNLEFRFEETDLNGLLDGVANKSLDVGVAALTVTSAREAVFDFSHPIYSSGLGIAINQDTQQVSLTQLLRRIGKPLLEAIALLGFILLLTGATMWFFERKANPDEFGGSMKEGLFEGFWWSAVTMTTVGYGDRVPKTKAGRITAMLWMFTSIIVISAFTASIASLLTISQLQTGMRGPQDLKDHTVATVTGSTSEAYMKRERLSYVDYPNIGEAYTALQKGSVDALVYDAPLLQYLSQQTGNENTSVLNMTFERQDYALALSDQSDLRESVNQVILSWLTKPWWHDTLFNYLGKAP